MITTRTLLKDLAVNIFINSESRRVGSTNPNRFALKEYQLVHVEPYKEKMNKYYAVAVRFETKECITKVYCKLVFEGAPDVELLEFRMLRIFDPYRSHTDHDWAIAMLVDETDHEFENEIIEQTLDQTPEPGELGDLHLKKQSAFGNSFETDQAKLLEQMDYTTTGIQLKSRALNRVCKWGFF